MRGLYDDGRAPSLFEGINARYYRSSEIAKSFVPNEQFEQLAVRQHSVVVGPRGSGKTTLLRMLHPECLRIWTHPIAESIRARIDFTAAYVSTDKVWREQIDATSSSLVPSEKERFLTYILSLDVMSAILRTIEVRFSPTPGAQDQFRLVSASQADQARFAEEIAEGWGLAPKFFDLGSLRIALRNKRIEARNWCEDVKLRETTNLRVVPWDDAVLLAVDTFESITGLRGELWAILFDELEIVPPAVRDRILGSARGADPRLLLKCSLSPWLKDHALAIHDDAPTVFNDFTLIRLFYGRRSESYPFSRTLIEGRLNSIGIHSRSREPVENIVFGASRFVSDDVRGKMPNRTAAAYGDSSALAAAIRKLSACDLQFRQWLTNESIDPGRLSDLSEKRRAETLRKARNVIIARLEFRSSKGLLRSRKTMTMYAGGATMLDICEGNPRLLLGVLVPLLEYFDGHHPVPENYQADVLTRIADDFYALIDAIPLSDEVRSIPELGNKSLRHPYREIIDRIARYFRNEVLRGPFNPQPASTFRIPRDSSEALQTIIGRLINMGAIVIVPDRGIKDILIGSFDQHRLRLSYLIAAREHLPPNVDRPVSIWRVLGSETPEAEVQSELGLGDA